MAMPLNLTWYQCGTVQQYRRRVARESNKRISQLWSLNWFGNAVKWKLQLERDWKQQAKHLNDTVPADKLSTRSSLAPVLCVHVGSAWMKEHRAYHAARDHLVSRVLRRRRTGKVQPR